MNKPQLLLPLALVAKLLDISEESVRRWRLTRYEKDGKPAYDWREAYQRDLEKRAGPNGRGFPSRDTVMAVADEIVAQCDAAVKRGNFDEASRLVREVNALIRASGIDLEGDS